MSEFSHYKHGDPTAVYRYTDAFVVARYETQDGKQIVPWKLNGVGWIMGGADKPRPLYGDLTAKQFILVEGEKCVEHLKKLGITRTPITWPGGAQAWKHANWEALEFADVLLFPDHDEVGLNVMTAIGQHLLQIADKVQVIDHRDLDLPKGWDIADTDWDTAQLNAWAQPLIRVVTPSGAREPGSDDESEIAIAETTTVIADEEPKPERRRIKWSELEGKTPPERNWIISHWLTHGPTLLAGQGGIGKTLLAQMIGTAVAMGRPYIDEVREPANVLFWACEDDHDELWRRQIAICSHLDIPMSALEEKLIVEPRLGMDNALMLQQFSQPTWTPLRQELRQQVNDYKASVLIVDNIGQCFGGNENDRHHVTAFLSGLVGLSEAPLAVLMLGHPAKAVGSEYSGSTAWETAVRMRWYMGTTLPDQKPEEGEEPDSTIRYLCKRKANYSQLDYRVLTYTDGAYACDAPKSGPSFTQKYGAGARNHAADALVQGAIEEFFRQRIRVTAGQRSPDYFVEKMRQAKINQDYTTRELNESLMRLRLAGKIVEKAVGTYSNRGAMMGLAPA